MRPCCIMSARPYVSKKKSLFTKINRPFRKVNAAFTKINAAFIFIFVLIDENRTSANDVESPFNVGVDVNVDSTTLQVVDGIIIYHFSSVI